MNKNTRITRVAVNKDNEVVAYSGRTKIEAYLIHSKATKQEIAEFIKSLEGEIKQDTLTFDLFGELFDDFDDALSEDYGYEDADSEDSEDDEEEKKSMCINADYKAKYAQNNDSCGDELANVLHEVVTVQVPKIGKDGKQRGTKDSCCDKAMEKIAKDNGILDRFHSWGNLNIGHIRMVLRNTLFAMINRGEKVVVGKKVWKENKKLQQEVAERKKKSAKKFADLKKKSAKKDNKVKKNKKSKKAA